MIEKYINAWAKECFRGVELDTPLSSLEFHLSEHNDNENIQSVLHTNLGSITVLDRLTGFGWRDVETGYRDKDGKFWLASGGYDVRDAGDMTVVEAVEWVKERANACVGEQYD